METLEARPARPAPAPRETKRVPLLVVGIVLFLGSELMFFSSLFGTYFTLRAIDATWTPPDIKVDAIRLLSTSILVASSGTMQMAAHRIKQGRVASMKRWIWLTFLMGAAFLGFQAHEWMTTTFQIRTNAYGSTFFAMTGFHGLHVFAGLVIMLVILGRAATGAYSAENHAGVEVATYYWHFVDVVWIALFTTIFVVR
jgi:cytochrome c oxidase subunit III